LVQVLHLERLAKHKGSTLGNYPDEPQPTQKMFESQLWHQMQFEFRPDRVIWVENESAKVGKIAVPNRVWKKMAASPRIHITTSLEDRVRFTMGDYSYFSDGGRNEQLIELLGRLEKFAGKKKVKEWVELVRENKFYELTKELIVEYYDKNYQKPRGEALRTYPVPDGLILDPTLLLHSPLIEEIIAFGQELSSRSREEGELGRTDEAPESDDASQTDCSSKVVEQ
jgi:tRNA 2-selenouridine synthase